MRFLPSWLLIFIFYSFMLYTFLFLGLSVKEYVRVYEVAWSNYRTLLVFLLIPLTVSGLLALILQRINLIRLLFFSVLFGVIIHGMITSTTVVWADLPPSDFYREKQGDITISKDFLIAHAGGTIDGISGTNSLEAVENSRDQQFSFFELDLLISKDNRIVAAHDWKHFLEITGFVGKKGAALRQAEFVKQKIHGRYTPLDAEKISKFLEENPDMILVTDKIRDMDLLEKELYFPDQMIVECFSPWQYEKAQEMGYLNPAYRVSSLAAASFAQMKKVPIVTVPGRMIRRYPYLFKHFHERGVAVLVYSGEDLVELQGTHFSMLYVDSLGFD